ncbi:MAG: PspA/IM30 family protein [Tannerella sp.]|jgi:phage shock protein A|nr:PspA/IM30 family protein [Tannerella sp.]
MNIFKRLLRIGQAEIHSAVDKMEDPIRMTEQGIREMRDDLDKALHASAQIKATAIRTKNDKMKKENEAQDYENKAILLLTKAQKGEIDMGLAEKLAKEALSLKENLLNEAESLGKQLVTHEKASDDIQKNVEILRFNITKWENELKTLKSRIRVSRATKEVNKQMAQIDGNSTISMLERMKEKVEEEEALAEAYGDMAGRSKNTDDEINKVLGDETSKVNRDLDDIKRRLGMLPEKE